jgi:hypothetical protein
MHILTKFYALLVPFPGNMNQVFYVSLDAYEVKESCV